MNQTLLNLISCMRTRGGASLAKIEEAAKILRVNLPEDYREFLWITDGATGFISKDLYAIFWSVDELAELNEAYQANARVPDLRLFGSTGSGEAFAFDTSASTLPIVLVPFVPMKRAFATVKAEKFSDLFSQMPQAINDPSITDVEVVEIKPVYVGGDPDDRNNKVALDRRKHVEYVKYWNNLIDSLQTKQGRQN